MTKGAKNNENGYKTESCDYVEKIPEGWQLFPNIALFDERVSRANNEKELLSVTIGKGIVRQSDNNARKDTSNEDKSNYKLVEIGDIAYNKMRMWQGAVGASAYKGIVSPAYVVLRPRYQVNPSYYHYLFRTKYYNNYAKRFSYGLCDDQLNLRYNDFKRMYSIFPPYNVQTKIVKYLDRKTEQANRIIENKAETIRLLKEKKKYIISKFIISGLNNEVSMGPSGIDWIGDIPKHWEVRKLKYCTRLISEQVDYKEEDEIYISLEKIESWTGEFNLEIGTDDFESTVKRFDKNDVLFGRLRPYLAKVITPNKKGVCVGELLVIRPKRILYNEYLKYLLLSVPLINLVDSSTFGAKMPRASWGFISQIPIPVPEIEEQIEISKYIDFRVEEINKLISSLERDINIINKYLESLVFHVVTGQINIE